MSEQTRWGSFRESLINVLAGMLFAIVSYQLIMPLLGYDITFGDNLIITGYFTVGAVARHYIVRRIYNAHIRQEV